MRTPWIILAIALCVLAAFAGSALAPAPAVAESKEMIRMEQQISQILQTQTDLRSAIDSNYATMRTLVQQSLDASNQLSGQMVSLQKAVQEVQANAGSRIDSMSQTTQGLSDNLQDVQARVGKLAQQLTDVQNLLQSIDSKVSGGAVGAPSGSLAPSSYTGGGPGGGPSGSSLPPISSDTLYQNALRDFTSGRYDLARQEFSDFIAHFPQNDLASNSQFYLGEIAYAQNDFQSAISAYESVLTSYPKSFKIAASLLKKGMAELEIGQKAAGTRDLRDVVRRFPGSEESHKANAKLHEIGAATPSSSRAPH